MGDDVVVIKRPRKAPAPTKKSAPVKTAATKPKPSKKA